MFDDLSIAMIEPGEQDSFPDGLVHCKVAPSIIVCQCLVGRYEVHRGTESGWAGPGEVFLACTGDLLRICHHHDPEAGRMAARWLHIGFRLCGVIDLSSLFTLPLVHGGPSCHEWGRIIQEFLDRRSEASLPWSVRRHQLAFRLLSLLLAIATFHEERLRSLRDLERLQPVLAFVKENLAAPLTVEDLAGAANLSRSRFHACFREHLQCTPMNYVKTIRLQEAQRLLMTTDLSLAEIAERVGFTNPFHFSREFRARNGIPPSVYRRQHRAGLL